MKGRGANRAALRQTRDARFGRMREESEARKQAEVAAGTRRRPFFTDAAGVRPDDEVAKQGGGFTADASDPSEWETVDAGDGVTVVFVRGFDPDNSRGMF